MESVASSNGSLASPWKACYPRWSRHARAHEQICGAAPFASLNWQTGAEERKLWIHLGPTGFDMGCETSGAYRGAGYLVKLTCKLIVANEDNYALAA
jgi:hypothetical protein